MQGSWACHLDFWGETRNKFFDKKTIRSPYFQIPLDGNVDVLINDYEIYDESVKTFISNITFKDMRAKYVGRYYCILKSHDDKNAFDRDDQAKKQKASLYLFVNGR